MSDHDYHGDNRLGNKIFAAIACFAFFATHVLKLSKNGIMIVSLVIFGAIMTILTYFSLYILSMLGIIAMPSLGITINLVAVFCIASCVVYLRSDLYNFIFDAADFPRVFDIITISIPQSLERLARSL